MAKPKPPVETMTAPVSDTYLYEGLALTPEDHLNIFRLADGMSDPVWVERFPQWGQRAAALSMTLPQAEMYRRTPEYQMALRQITILKATEGAAQTVANLVQWAKDGDTNAFRTLAKMGGSLVSSPSVQVNNTQVNVSLEQRLETLVQERRAKVIDAG